MIQLSKRKLAVLPEIELPAHIREKFHFENECWVWHGAVGNSRRNKYGVVGVKGRNRQATHVVYEIMVGPIESGLVIDHLCRNTLCVNPAHLEPVTRRENMERGQHANGLSLQTHCSRGHEFAVTGMTMRIRPVGPQRICHVCDAMRSRKCRMRKKNEIVANL